MKVVDSDVKFALAGYNFSGYNSLGKYQIQS